MSLVYYASFIAPSAYVKRYIVNSWAPQIISGSKSSLPFVGYRFSRRLLEGCTCNISGNELHNAAKFSTRSSMNVNSQSFGDGSFEWEDLAEVKDTGSPWEGAIIYKRNASVSHVEYCTTLERLGLAALSTDFSKSRASLMGIRVTKAVKDYPTGTPVQVSIDVTRKKKKLRLDGIVKTVITLGCNRCGEPAAESVFSNFSLLLTEDPVEEPEIIDMGTIFSKDNSKSSAAMNENEEDDNEATIDWDDRMYFPPEQKEIDISKNIRDLVHIEITINAICDPSCKGICLKCGTNLNTNICNCGREKVQEKGSGPLKNLREQMQAKS